MEKTIIIVWEGKDKGKTVAIRKVCKKMATVEKNIIHLTNDYLQQIDFNVFMNDKELKIEDIITVLRFKNTNIGIISRGDPKSENVIKDSFDIFEKKECSLIICAARKHTSIRNYITNNYENKYQIKTFSNMETGFICASELYDLIVKTSEK